MLSTEGSTSQPGSETSGTFGFSKYSNERQLLDREAKSAEGCLELRDKPGWAVARDTLRSVMLWTALRAVITCRQRSRRPC